jgi:hypothetical protein
VLVWQLVSDDACGVLATTEPYVGALYVMLGDEWCGEMVPDCSRLLMLAGARTK